MVLLAMFKNERVTIKTLTMSLQITPELMSLVYTLIYLTIAGFVLSIIYGIIEWFSRDRAIKIFEGKYAFIFLGNEVYYGKIKVPPRSGGGFEIIFPLEGIENPKTLLAYLMASYYETKDEKFLKEARKILEKFKKRGILPESLKLEDIKTNPWSSPSLISRKVFSQELGNLNAIIIFKHTLSKKDRIKRQKELKRLFHQSIFAKMKRKIYNSLAYVKDKIGATISKTSSSMMSTLTPEIRSGVETLQKKIVERIGSTYDSLLENSIGRLITVQVKDIDGETRYYQGILREYSNNYIVVYNVNYKIKMKTKFKGIRLEEPPRPLIVLHGWVFSEKPQIVIKELHQNDNKTEIILSNISNEFVKVISVKVNGKEIKVTEVMGPNEVKRIIVEGIEREPLIEILYEISREADILWPRSKVRIIGLGDYPIHNLKEILRLSQ